MKRLVFLLPTLFIATLLSAQSYFPTSDQNPVWTMHSNSFGGFMEEFEIITGTDTLFCNDIWTPVIEFHIEDEYQHLLGYYRVDDDKVYVRHSVNCEVSEDLMYDFGVEIDEYFIVGISPNWHSIDSALCWAYNIDTLYVGGVSRKSLDLFMSINSNGTPSDRYTHWIEGFGEIQHPFPSFTCLAFCESGASTSCITLNDSIVYASPNSNVCQYDLTRIYVDLDPNNLGGVNDGTSWEDAFPNLQDAIAIADYGDTIWVAQGTYYPTDTLNRQASFHIPNGVVVLGGFNGAETQANQRDYLENETILSGDIGILEDSTDNVYHVLRFIDTDSLTILDGFTITKGYAREGLSTSEEQNRGGGILLKSTALPTRSIIQNCIFRNNSAIEGGAIFGEELENGIVRPKISNCQFISNTALRQGGGVSLIGQKGNEEKLINSCTFHSNFAGEWGGAIFLLNIDGKVSIENCLIENNESLAEGGGVAINFNESDRRVQMDFQNCDFNENISKSGGGLSYINFAVTASDTFKFNFDSCTFIKNRANSDVGGGLYFGIINNYVSSTITNSSFIENYGKNGGGGIHVFFEFSAESNLFVKNSEFINNRASFAASGGINVQGVFEPASHQSLIENCLFTQNGGALMFLTGFEGRVDGDILNCTFYDNGTAPIVKNWSAIHNENHYAKLNITNSIIWEPSLALGRILYNNDHLNLNLHDYSILNTLISADNCDLPGGDMACGEGMIFNQNPLFLDTTLLDLRLAACSPAINAGMNLDSLSSITDLDGGQRVLEDIIDMGAYERNSFDIQIEEILDVSCYEGQDGQVSFAIEGDEPYEYSWTRDSISGEGNDQLTAGDYLFTITDSNDCRDTLSLTISQPESIIGQYTINHASTPSTSDGSIILDELIGGTSPYEFSWNNGDTTASLINIPPGEYMVTVTDSNGCVQTYEFEVSFLSSTDTEQANFQIILHPNPVKDQVILSLTKPLSERSQWLLYNNLGQAILTYELNPFQKEYQIALSHIPQGVYFWEVHYEGSNINKGKLIILNLE